MKKIDLLKAREAFAKSKLAKTRFDILFPEGIDLAAAAQTAKEQNAEYIELEGYASTTALNDKGFMIAASAWKDAVAYERIDSNPIVLFHHNGHMPSGQIVEHTAKDDGLWVRLRIRYNVILPTGEKIGDVIADGTLRALSIGIDEILEFEIVEDPNKVTAIVTKLRLAEISVVSIGSDPGATCSVAEEFDNIFNLASITDEIKGGFTMWKLLAKKYGMADDATEEQVMAEYQRREQLGADALRGLGLDPEKATAAEITAALAQRDPAKLAKLTAQNLVNGAVLAHKIADNDEETKTFALALAETNPTQFEAWVKLQKEVAPPTNRLTGGNLGGPPGGDEKVYITKEDREICKLFGKFKTAEDMDKMAEIAPNEALSFVLGIDFPATKKDREILAARRSFDTVCGIIRPE
jgi:HK97 family phage prohead protease